MSTPTPKWITLDRARTITGHDTNKALRKFIESHNHRALQVHRLILCRPNYVEEHSLLRALQEQAATYTPGYKEAQVLQEMDRANTLPTTRRGAHMTRAAKESPRP